MFIRIIKKSLKDKPIMNLVVFLFIILASSFLASSINSLSVVTTSIDRYLSITKIPDFIFITTSKSPKVQDDILTWMKQSNEVQKFGVDDSIMIDQKNIKVNGGDYDISVSYVLQKQPKEYSQIYTQEDELLVVNQGEIALPNIEHNQRNIQLGDVITLEVGSIRKDFVVSQFTKDSLCGSSLMGRKRLILNDDDYNELSKDENNNFLMFHSIKSNQVDTMIKDFHKQNFSTLFVIEQDVIQMIYLVEKLISGILILYSISLILISFCILRFTILFSLQEEYKEIGIMKGIGIRNKGIQQLYILKYVAIGLIGSFFGFFLSIWLQRIVINLLRRNIIIKQSEHNLYLNLICCIFVVLIIIFYSFMVTRKISRLSVMDVIRDGNPGERFHNAHRISLNKGFRSSTIFFLAVKDILCQWKRYISLTFTFTLGIIFIILPLNAVNTLNDSNTTMPLLGVQASDVFISTRDITKYLQYQDTDLLKVDIEAMEQYYLEHNINLKLQVEIGYSFTLESIDSEERINVLTLQGLRSDYNKYLLTDGVMPMLPNEVAVSHVCAKKLGAEIGDTITAYLDQKEFIFLITGIYENMNNMGESMRIAPTLELKGHTLASILDIQGTFQDREHIEEQLIELKDLSKDMIIYDGDEYVENAWGDISEQINQIRDVIVLIVLGVNGLITLLMMRLFSSKEQTEIAMLKSLGFRNHTIKRWQVYRIMLILLIALFLGVLISYPLSHFLLRAIFTVLGAANIKVVIHPVEVFIKYPLIIFVITSVIAFFSIGNVKKIDFTAMKHME